MTVPASRSYTALLISNLPSRVADWVVYLGFALALRFALGMSAAVTAGATVATFAGGIAFVSAAELAVDHIHRVRGDAGGSDG